ncbi:glutathione S-transferase [Humitalea rosea]|uniref:Glutathione S-transferase n=1 Tax=Humitalea rosea TaxID=990373 RepID=A0A2W7ITI8_9PROT|nr:glutathione S-transferase family protein [Humitalea rosea]PZW51146.1 glutathione S-transferase [Humitalea rosea]
MLTILGRKTSSNVMKLLWLCEELGIAYEREDIGGPFGGNTEPAYLARNPNGLVPTIVEADGFTLYESNAILRYLAATHGGERLYPADPRRRAKVEQWLDWQLGMNNRPMTVMFITLIRVAEAERNMAAVARARDEAEALWRIVEAELEGRPYLCGEALTLADIALGIYVHRWFVLPIARPELPQLAAWYARLKTHKGYADNCLAPLV